MKKRFYHIKNKDRWLGLAIAVSSVYILSEANVDTQWLGWLLSVIACFMWVWFGYRDKDYPRALMELMYLILSMRAMYNWLI
jgi:drug/metabolite transporter (DMT)-like permease